MSYTESVSLPYTIIYCSSEDPNYPIASIQNASIRSSGWQSLPNPKYPVDFIIDLGANCDLDSLQFVSHQSKIANKVELQFGDDGRNFRVLGSFQFSDNSHTQHAARELKTANLQRVNARFVRIKCMGCHPNPSNQVGLVSLKILGKGDAKQRPLSRQNTAQASADLDSQIAILERQKNQAVQEEDYLLAEKIKQQIESLKSRRDLLERLESELKAAVLAQEYATAASLKSQIQALLSGDSVPEPIVQAPRYEPPPRPAPIQRPVTEDIPPPKPIRKQTPPHEDIPPMKPPKDDFVGDEEGDYFEVPPISQHDGTISDDRPIHGDPNAQMTFNDDEEEEPRPRKKMIDSRPLVPTTIKPNKRSTPPPPPTELPTDDVCETPDELSDAHRTEASLLISHFGEGPVAKFYSKNFQTKASGIKELGEGICGLAADYLDAFNRFCFILKGYMSENQRLVVSTAFEQLKSIADTHMIEGNDLSKAINPMIPAITAKVNGSNTALGDQAQSFLVWLAGKKCVDVVLPILMTEPKKGGTPQGKIARVKALHEIIIVANTETGKLPLGLTLDSVMSFAVSLVESPKVEVRKEVIEMIVTLETIFGTSVNRYFEKINDRTRKEIEHAISQCHEEELDE